MSSKNLDVLRVLALVVFVLGWLSANGSAQTPPTEPAPAVDKVAELEKTVQSLIGQVAKLAAPKPVTPDERTAQARESFARQFKTAKAVAGPACREAGGKLRVTIDSAGKAAVSCEW